MGDNLSNMVKYTFATQQTAALPGEIHQANNIPVAKSANPFFHLLQAVVNIGGTNQRAD